MGDNAAFTNFESVVMAVYDAGVLDKKLLVELIKPFRDGDIDSGGMVGTLSKKDKLDIVDVVIKTSGQTPPVQLKLPKDYTTWTDVQCKMNDDWQDKRWQMFRSVTKF